MGEEDLVAEEGTKEVIGKEANGEGEIEITIITIDSNNSNNQ